MPRKFCQFLATALLTLISFAVAPTPASANQGNYCRCLETEASPCKCTKNWTISPMATHTYIGQCYDVNGEKSTEADGYSISMSVNGTAKKTTCFLGDNARYYLNETHVCTNWSLTKKDGTSTVVTCRKD